MKIEKLNSQFLNNDIHIDLLNFEKLDYNILNIYHTLPIEKKKLFLKRLEDQLNENFDTTMVFILLIEKIPISEEIKNKYIETIHGKLETAEKVTQDDYQNFYITNPIVQYLDLIYSRIIIDKKISSLNIEVELFKFIVSPESYNKNKFDVEWLNIFHDNSFIEKFSQIAYIIEKLEDYLIDNKDEKLNEIYFMLKQKAHS